MFKLSYNELWWRTIVLMLTRLISKLSILKIYYQILRDIQSNWKIMYKIFQNSSANEFIESKKILSWTSARLFKYFECFNRQPLENSAGWIVFERM